MAEREGEGWRGTIQRVERLLAGLARVRRQPNRREAYHLCDALDHLRAGRFPEAEDAVVRAERVTPLPADVSSRLATNTLPTLEDIQAELNELIATLRDR